MPAGRQTNTPKKYDFFISRNKADKGWAVWIAWQLDRAGYAVIVQDWDFGSGNNFVLRMQEAITSSNRTIAVLSPDFLKSEFTGPEWAAAFAEDPTGTKQKLIPVKVRRCSPTGLLSQLVWIDLLGLDEPMSRETLLTEIKPGRRKPATAPPFPGKSAGRKPAFPGPAKTSPSARARSTKTGTKATASSSTTSMISAKAAAEMIEQHNWGASKDRRSSWSSNPWLGVVLVPARQSSPYMDVLDLGNQERQDSLRVLAIKGANSVLRSDRGTETKEHLDHLSFTQAGEGMNGLSATLEVYTDGTIVYRTVLISPSNPNGAFRSMGEGFVIDQTMVRNAVAGCVKFANNFYNQRRRDPGTVHLGASLTGIQHKFFGQFPAGEVHSFRVPDHRLDDPLHVPAAPLALTTDRRRAADAVAKTVMDHFARRFRVENAYYPEAQGR